MARKSTGRRVAEPTVTKLPHINPDPPKWEVMLVDNSRRPFTRQVSDAELDDIRNSITVHIVSVRLLHP